MRFFQAKLLLYLVGLLGNRLSIFDTPDAESISLIVMVTFDARLIMFDYAEYAMCIRFLTR